ncbi:outer membrane beta-barrel protein [Paracnuella aquatica]|uniref:outer membrane beta-barrel protein n=1 Tax=Paracnuella aquatica TaxID=2268757 RepID=UPI000DEEB054|nr:outer membrane beta-barrel protein [Paracnuella aquatica]RPD49085.1 hypothetical protein DRJ53_08190 [Paracnuella aquatica]
MQFVNDDMDDVFRKAGEHYPLQVTAPDWDKMQQALEAADKQGTTTGLQKQRPVWLLALIPFLVLCTTYFPVDKPQSVAVKKSENKNVVNEKPTPFNTANDTELAQDGVTAQGLVIAKSNGVKNREDNSVTNRSGNFLNSANTSDLPKQLISDPREQKVRRIYEASDKGVAQREDAAPAQSKPHANIELLPVPSKSNLLQNKQPAHAGVKIETPKPAPQRLFRNTGLYAGLLGSLDFTTIEFQKTNRIGRQLGVVAGYRLNKKWSLETGLYFSKKFYYSEGSYYKSSRAYVPPNTSIVEVDGTCLMLEVPFLLKYDFTPHRNTGVFATAGLSSYFMKKEAYNYLYYYHNSGTYAQHSKQYRNESNNLFSVAHLSGGISHKIGRTTALRVEPYIKLPITGLGYGKMHFTSAGMNMGVVKSF